MSSVRVTNVTFFCQTGNRTRGSCTEEASDIPLDQKSGPEVLEQSPSLGPFGASLQKSHASFIPADGWGEH